MSIPLERLYHYSILRDAVVQVSGDVDIMVSHDWPTIVPRYGDTAGLLRCKPYFADEVNSDALGSPANWQLLQVRPDPHACCCCMRLGVGLPVPWPQLVSVCMPSRCLHRHCAHQASWPPGFFPSRGSILQGIIPTLPMQQC